MAQATIDDPHDGSSGLARALRVVVRVGVLCVAGFLLLAGAFKMQDRESFAAIVHAQGIVPAGLASPLPWLVGLGEISVGMLAVWCVLQQRWVFVRAGALSCSIVFLVFAAYASALVIKPPPVPTPCGCLPGEQEIASWWPIMIRNGMVASLLAGGGLLRG